MQESLPLRRAFVQAIGIELAGAKDTLATKSDIAELRLATKNDITGLRHDLELKIEGLRAEMHSNFSSHLRQMYGAVFGQFAVLLGFLYFFLNHSQH